MQAALNNSGCIYVFVRLDVCEKTVAKEAVNLGEVEMEGEGKRMGVSYRLMLNQNNKLKCRFRQIVNSLEKLTVFTNY